MLYHRVIDLKTDPQLLAVSPLNFEHQVKYLKKNFPILSMQDLQQILSEKTKIPQNSVLISFDDGYYDNYTIALDILEKFKTPAIFYIATATLNTDREYWWDELERRVLQYSGKPQKIDLNINGWNLGSYELSVQTSEKLYTFLLPRLKKFTPKSRSEFFDFLQTIVPSKARDTHRPLKIDELKALNKSPFATIGAHTHNHPSLAALDVAEQRDEIVTSKKILENYLQSSVNFFSYPFGSKVDYDASTIEICRSAGFSLVAANFPGRILLSSNPLQLPRYLVRNWGVSQFKQKLYSFR